MSLTYHWPQAIYRGLWSCFIATVVVFYCHCVGLLNLFISYAHPARVVQVYIQARTYTEAV